MKKPAILHLAASLKESETRLHLHVLGDAALRLPSLVPAVCARGLAPRTTTTAAALATFALPLAFALLPGLIVRCGNAGE
eukprot:9279429-Lingulodinium_polyedra.AAC.1